MPNESLNGRLVSELDDDEFVEHTDIEEISADEIEELDAPTPSALSQSYPPELAADLNDLDDPAYDDVGDQDEPDDAELAALADELGVGLRTDPPGDSPPEVVVPTGPIIDVPDELASSEPGQLELGEVSALKVLFGCAMSGSSGIARFRNETGTIKLHYRAGVIELVRCTIPSLSLGAFLLERGGCSNEELEAALQAGGELSEALVAAGALGAPQMTAELVEWSKGVLAQLVTWSAGSCHFLEGRALESRSRLGFSRFKPLEDAVRLGLGEAPLLERFQRILNRSLLVLVGGPVSVDDLGLDAPERNALSRLDGDRSLQDLLAELEADPEGRVAALRAVHLGLESGLIEIGPGPVARAQLKRVQELERELAQLRQKRNFFELLGVGSEATDAEVKKSYLDLVDLYTRDTAPKELPQLTEVRAKLSDLLDKAFTALSTREKRERGASVVARISPVSSQPQSLPPRAPSMPPAAKAQSSVELFEAAEAAILKANYTLALQKIDEAIEARPDRVQYRLYKEYYKVLSDKYDRITAAGNAIKEIQKLVGDNDKVVDAHLLMGRLYKFARKKAEAGAAFERVLELDPDNQEAKTEVRIKSNRDKSAVIQQPSRAESALSFIKKRLNLEEEDPKAKKKKKPPPV